MHLASWNSYSDPHGKLQEENIIHDVHGPCQREFPIASTSVFRKWTAFITIPMKQQRNNKGYSMLYHVLCQRGVVHREGSAASTIVYWPSCSSLHDAGVRTSKVGICPIPELHETLKVRFPKMSASSGIEVLILESPGGHEELVAHSIWRNFRTA